MGSADLVAALEETDRGGAEQRQLDSLEGSVAEASEATSRVERAQELIDLISKGADPRQVTEEVDRLLRYTIERFDEGRLRDALRLARAVSGLLLLAYRWRDLVHLLGLAAAAAQAVGDRVSEAWALRELGTLQLAAGHEEVGAALLHEAGGLSETSGDVAGVDLSSHNLSYVQPQTTGMLAQFAGVLPTLGAAKLAVLAGIAAVIAGVVAGGFAVGGGWYSLGGGGEVAGNGDGGGVPADGEDGEGAASEGRSCTNESLGFAVTYPVGWRDEACERWLSPEHPDPSRDDFAVTANSSPTCGWLTREEADESIRQEEQNDLLPTTEVNSFRPMTIGGRPASRSEVTGAIESFPATFYTIAKSDDERLCFTVGFDPFLFPVVSADEMPRFYADSTSALDQMMATLVVLD